MTKAEDHMDVMTLRGMGRKLRFVDNVPADRVAYLLAREASRHNIRPRHFHKAMNDLLEEGVVTRGLLSP